MFQLGAPPPEGFGATSNPPLANPIQITKATTLTIAATTRPLTGRMTMNGKQRTNTAAVIAVEGEDGTHLGDMADGTYNVRLAAGSYGVRYFNALTDDEKTMPRSSDAYLGCITIE